MKNITLLKINIEPENNGLEDDFPFPGGPYSQVKHVNLLRVQVRCSPAITCKPRFVSPHLPAKDLTLVDLNYSQMRVDPRRGIFPNPTSPALNLAL